MKMKRLVFAAVALAAAATFGATNYVQRTERSKLGKEIDEQKVAIMKTQIDAWNRDARLYVLLTNVQARVEALEAAESNRTARAQAAREARAKRAQGTDAKDVLRNAIRRAKKVEQKKAEVR